MATLTHAERGAIRRNRTTRPCARCGKLIPDAQVSRRYCSASCTTLAYSERKTLAQVRTEGQVPCPQCATPLTVRVGYPKRQRIVCPGCGAVHQIRLAEDADGVLAAIRDADGHRDFARVQLPETT